MIPNNWMRPNYSNSQNGQYDNALICKNGHIINAMANQFPEDNKKFCEKCGESALSKCDKCGTSFRGNMYGDVYELPSFCFNCGAVFSWTQLKIESAIELAVSSENIDDAEKIIIRNAIPEIIKDTPRTSLEATKLLKVLRKIGNGTANLIKDLIVDITSEIAVKILWGEKRQ